jgi:hypothetical protein
MSTPNINVILAGSISQFNNRDASQPLLSQEILQATFAANGTFYDPFFACPIVGNVVIPLPPSVLVYFAYIKCIDSQLNAGLQVNGNFSSGASILWNVGAGGFLLYNSGVVTGLPNITGLTISGFGSGVTAPVYAEILIAGL